MACKQLITLSVAFILHLISGDHVSVSPKIEGTRL